MSIYWRAQPKGKSIFGHQSRLAYDQVQGVFAFDDPRKIFDTVTWLHIRKKLDDYEMVKFKGREIEQPEDSEGYVVAPVRELSRVPMQDWIDSIGGVPTNAAELQAADSGGHALGANVARQSVASAYGADQVAKVSGSGSTYRVTLKSGKVVTVKVDGSTGTVVDPTDGHTIATHTVSEAGAYECGCKHAHPPSVPVTPCDEAPQPAAVAIVGVGEKGPPLSWRKIHAGEYTTKGKRGTYHVHKLFEVWVVALDRHLLTASGVRGNVDNCATFGRSDQAKRFAERVDVRGKTANERVEGVGERVEGVGEAGSFATVGRDAEELKRGHALGKVNTPARVWAILHTPLAKENQEVFLVIPLDLYGQALSRPVEVARGQRDRVNVNEADVLRPVHTTNAKGFIVVHNHPSMHASPSEKDKALTKHLKDACKGASFQMLDHIIIASSGANGEYYSFTENKLTKVT